VRIVADTNVIVSAFLWGGVPRRLLDAVEAQQIELFGSIKNRRIFRQLQLIDRLPKRDQEALACTIDAFLAKGS